MSYTTKNKPNETIKKEQWGTFLKSLLSIALPIAIQNLLTTTASMVDTMMIAPLGETYVGALGLCAQFSSLMFSGYWGFVGGGMLFFAQYWGAKDKEGIERSYGMTLTAMMMVAFLFGLTAILKPSLVMKIYTDKVSMQEIGVQYLRIVGIAYILQVVSMAMSALLRSTERVRIPMLASIFSVVSNLFLNWVLIYGHLGFPAMGIRGAAIATSIAAGINVLAIVIMAMLIRYPYLFAIKGHFKWERKHLKLYLVKCFPIICDEILMGIGFMVINITLGRQTEHVIAALAVFRTLEGLVIGFFAGFSNAASVLVGKYVGAGELHKAYHNAKRLIYICSGVIFLVSTSIFLLRHPILSSMSLSGESYQAGTVFLLIYIVASTIRMGNWLHNDTFRSSGDPMSGTVMEIVFMYLVVLPCVLVSAFVLHLPYWCIFIACYIDEPIRYILMQRMFYSAKWIKPITDLGKAALPAFHEERTK